MAAQINGGKGSAENGDPIGYVTSLTGQVVATGLDGIERILQVGDPVYANDLIQTIGLSTVVIDYIDGTRMDLGRNARAMIDEEVFNPEFFGDGNDLRAEIDEIQLAILSGADPTQILDPTAAGVGEVANDSGRSVGLGKGVVIELDGQHTTPQSGFDTEGLSATQLESTEDELLLAQQLEARLSVTFNDMVTGDDSPALTGTVNDPLALVEVTINGVVYQATNNGDGTWSLQDDAIAQLALGNTQLSVRAIEFDGNFVTASGSILVINNVPTAQASTDSAIEDGFQILGQVPVATDSDGDLNPNGYSLFSTIAEGALIFNPDGSYSFNPGAGFQELASGETREVTFYYTASDTRGGISAPVAVTITVTGTNDAPMVAAALTETRADNDSLLSIDLLTGSSDVDSSDSLSVSGLALVSGDTSGITVSGDVLIVDPSVYNGLAVGESEIVSYSYIISDGNGGSVPQTATITITGTNDGPVAQVHTDTAVEDGAAVSGTVPMASDADSDGIDPNGYALVTGVAEGGLVFNPDGSYTFNPGSDFQDLTVNETRDVVFTYTATDAQGAVSAPAIVTITVTGTNDGPVASNASESTGENTVLNGNVPTAGDVDGTIASYALVSGVTEGMLTFNPGGSYSFNPGVDFDDLAVGASRDVTFTYTATDSDGAVSSPATVTITVTGTNDGPVAQAHTDTAVEDGAAVSGTVPAATDADSDGIDPNGYALVTDVSEGGLVFSADGSYTFSPGADFQDLALNEARDVTFTYTATDAQGVVSAPATVTITVTGTNDGPVAQAHTDTALEDGAAVNGSVPTATDADSDGIDPNGYALVTDVSEGGLVFSADGSYTFSPGADFQDLALNEARDVTFTYTATDAQGVVSAPATVTITVTGTNDGPVAQAHTDTAVEDGAAVSGTVPAATDADSDGIDPNGYALVTDVSEGGLVFSSDGSYTFSPGADFQDLALNETRDVTFTYTATDAQGVVSAPATVTITVTGTEDAPVISGTTFGTVVEDATLSTTGTLTASDADAGDTPTFTAQSGTAGTHGSFDVTVSGDWTYTLDNAAAQSLAGGETVTETFTVAATTVDGESVNQTVTVTVTGTEDAPVISGTTSGVVVEDATLSTTGTLTTSDTDAGDTPTFTAQSGTAGTHGSFDVTVGGDWTYTLDNAAAQSLAGGETVTETFTVAATTVDGESVNQTVTVTVTGSEDVPVISGTTSGAVIEDTTLSTTGTLNVTDVDAVDVPTFTVQVGAAGSYGTFDVTADGDWTYNLDGAVAQSLADGETATETFNVVATTADGESVNQTVTITVTGTNDGPVATDASRNVSEDSQDVALNLPLPTDADVSDTLTIAVTGLPDPTLGAVTLGNGTPLVDGQPLTLAEFQNLQFDTVPNANGIDTFTYTVSDGTATAAGTATINVGGSNDAPVAVDNSYTTDEDTSYSGNVLTDDTGTGVDSDADGDSLTVSAVNGQPADVGVAVVLASGATLTMQANGSFSYDPSTSASLNGLAVGDSTTDSFSYTVDDGNGGTDVATVILTITGANDAATVSSANVTLTETDAPLTSSGTLTSTDVDNVDNAFTPSSTTGTYGDFSILANGDWSFTANSAFDELNSTDSYTETYNVSSVDGTASTVQITINGTNDAATVSSATVTLTETDVALITSGTLTSSDVDNTDNAFTPSSTSGTYGDFSILANGDWSFTANSAFDELNSTDSYTETFNVSSVDGTASTVQVTINGTNDAATVSSASVTLTETDAPLTSSGTLTSTDVDNVDNAFTPSSTSGTYGDFAIDAAGAWTFTANSAFDELNSTDSYTETFNVMSVDGTASTVQVTINGTNDAATVSSASVTLTETDAPLTSSGTLTSSDVDNVDNAFTPSSTSGTYGDFAIDAAGAWTFTANSAFDELNSTDSYTETFNVTSVDGTSNSVQITINGTNDAATVSSASVTLTETDAPLTSSGTLTSTDVDNVDNAFTPSSTTGTYGDFSILANGDWSFTANSAFDELNSTDSYTETFNVSSVDGTASTVQVTINGTNDAATVSSASVTLTESDAPLTSSGTLTSTDVDNVDNAFTPSSTSGTYGDFAIDAAGAWTFTANSAFDELNATDSYTETFNVTSVDGTSSSVQITINGTNDGPVAQAHTDTAVEDGAAVNGSVPTATDADSDGIDPNGYALVTDVSEGGLVFSADGSYTFSPGADFQDLALNETRDVTFTYTATDAQAVVSAPATVTITVTGTNDGPVATDASRNVSEDSQDVALNLPLPTDADVSDTLTIAVTGLPDPTLGAVTLGNGTPLVDGQPLTLAEFQNLQFDTVPNANGIDTFTYTVSDGTATAAGTATINVGGSNDAPVAVDNSYTTDEDTSYSGNVLTDDTGTGVDSDADGDSLTVSAVNGQPADVGVAVVLASGATLTMQANGSFSYDPSTSASLNGLAVGDSTTDSFSYTVDDGNGGTDVATVILTITGANDAATVSSANVTLTETDAPLTSSGTLTSTDVDNVDNAFTPSSTTGTYGDFAIDAAGAWTFTANSAFDELNSTDSYTETFNVTSVDGTSSSVQISINGTNDAATVSSASVTLTETDAPLTSSGTLTSTDVDNVDNAFTPSSTSGTYGDFAIDAAGAWTFTANSAFDELNSTDSYTETFNVMSVDGTASTVQVTINGTNDAATVSSASVTLTESDAPLTSSGTLTSTDVDNVDNAFTPSSTSGTYGDFSILANGAWTFTANSAFDELNATDSYTETFNVSSVDGTASTVQITINGTNDAATVSSASVTLTETDVALSTSGTLTSTDVDNVDNAFTPSSTTGTYGDFSILANGDWSFTANSAFDELNSTDSYTETFNVSSVDGTASTVQVTINGTNDAATVSSATVTLTETDAPLTSSGTLTSTDVDNVDNAFTPSSTTGTYGDFAIDAAGAWTFTANSAFDELNSTDSYTETFNVTSVDGTSSSVQISINGTNDAATVSSASVTLTESDAPLTSSGTLTSTDVDNVDNAFTPSSTSGTYGDFAIDAAGAWTFTANSAFDELNSTDSYTETFNVTSVDGTSSSVQISINGTNDAATVSSATVTLTETDAPLTSSGTLTSTDVDNVDNAFTPSSTTGTYGDFAIDAAGAWTFTANSAFDELNSTDSYTETFNVMSVDGTASTVQVTINGTNDAATVSSASVTLTETDAPLTSSGTLTSTDVDNVDNAFTPSSTSGTYGDFAIDAAGAWTFTANSAFDELNSTDSYTETFNVMSVDGTASTVQVTINGTNDAATVSSASVTLTETDAPLTSSGTLTSTDVDNVDNAFTPSSTSGTYGDFSILANGAWTFTANSAFDELNATDSYTETFNVSSVDGTASTVQITINGSNDAATVSSATVTLTETDAPLTSSGTLTSTDVDNVDNAFTPSSTTGTYGDFSILANGDWSFTANSAFDELNATDSYTETFNITSVDGTASTVQVTINGTNDAATVSSASVTLTESDAPLTSSGTLTSTDVDNVDNVFTPSSTSGTYGDFAIDAAGAWTFTANSAFDELNSTDSYTETFNVTSVDGTSSSVQITINGTNDAATVSSASVTLTETDAPLTSSGTLTSTDVDNVDNAFTPSSTSGTYGDFSILANGAWTFTANSAFDELNATDSYTETFNVMSVDGTASTVQVTINGTNDAATVSSASVTLTETDVALSTSGTLTSSDVDNTDNAFTPSSTTGTYGDFAIDAAGAWTFTANSAFDELNSTDSYTETFNVMSVDGTASTVQVTINGTNDAATVSSASVTLTESDAPLTSSGTLTSTDVDNVDNAFTPSSTTGTYGDFSILANGAWTFTANSAFDELNATDSYTETFNVSSVDGTASTVQVTINGTNDAATVSSASVTLTETDVALSTSGTLTSSDVDNTDNAFTPSSTTGTYGDFSILANGDWSFTANSAFDELNSTDSYTETFNVSSVDGTASTVQVTINGTNDAATVSSASVTLTETDVALSTSGTLTSSDVDNTDNAFTPSSTTGTYGDFAIDAAGAWTFTANSAFDELNSTDSYTETFNVMSVDGTASTVQVTINGTNDAATVSSASVTLTETDVALSTSGTLTSSDVDNTDNAFTPSSTTGTYGDFSILANGDWTFTANSAFDELNSTDSYTETFNVSSVDGTASTVQVTINGTNDAATVSSASVTLTETDAPLTSSGTLTSTDVDNVDNAFTPSSTSGTYGDFSILANGAWTFTANSAFDELNSTDSYTETFNVSSVDGTASTVQVTINGTNDAATVSSATVTLTETDAPLTSSGTLTSSDVDNTDNAFTPSSTTGTYGDFSILANGAWTFTANSAFDELNATDSYTETFNVSSVDGTASTVQVTINGTNDAATVSSASVTLTETDVALSTSGTLTSSDVDNTDNAFTPSSTSGTYGDFSILANGDWSFTANSAFDELNSTDSYTETFNVSSVDGTASTVQVTINGTNDAATVSSASVTLTETDAPLTSSGTLTSTDVDNVDNAFTPSSTTGTYGDFSILANGAWTFTANSAFDELNSTDSYTETFNVSSVDGTASTVQVTINGTNDAATVSSASVTLTETDVALSTSGTLTSSDVDNTDNAFTPSSTTGTYGDFSILANGAWTFTANSAFDELNATDSYTETFNVSSVDGTASTVQVTINGTNDAATVSSASVTLTETDVALSTSGTLTSSDVDNTDNAFTPSSTTGTYGDFAIDAAGAWTFTANSAFDELNSTDSYTETFNVMSVDGTASTVRVTINGTNDAATVSSASVTLTETDAPLTSSGTLTSTDVDNVDNAFTPSSTSGTYGDFSILANGDWSFTANSAFDELNSTDSYTETFNVMSVDGTASTVQITINGTNDAATVSSASVTLTETDAPLTSSGTLTSTDVDNVDNAFTPSSTTGTYGDFSILANGAWTFTANSAFDELNSTDSYTETFNVMSVDGTASTVQVTINGTNDAATVSSASVTLTETDAPLTSSGTLTSTDVDNVDNAFTPSSTTGTYGDFSILANGAWTFTANSAFDELNATDSYTETFNVSSVDGTASTVQITINGSNDAATVSSATVTLTETDAPLTSSGTLTSTDVDNVDNAFTPSSTTGTYGDFSILANGDWSFTANSAFDELNSTDSYTETFNVSSVDGTASTVRVTINGTNDAATVSSASVTLTETDVALSTSGTLTSTDVDNVDNAFNPSSTTGTYGDFSILANGDWTFTANSAFDELNATDSYTETFNVMSVDGTASTVQVTINGTNDAATVSSASVTLTETDAPLTSSGTLTSTDVDDVDNVFTPSSTTGTYGDFSILANGDWTFTANSAFDELNSTDSYTETFNVTSVDGTASTVQITINGTNDAATVSSATVTLTETDAPLTSSGTLTSTDVDNVDNAFTPSSTSGTYGDFSILANGDWTFTANSAFDELNSTDSYTETFNVTSVDGTASTVQITINGTNDAATVSSATVTLTETDAPLTSSGTLTSTDVDDVDNAFTPSSTTGTYGDFSILANGDWTFTANSAFDEFNATDSYTETFNVTSVDGTASTVQITINGTNDGPVIDLDQNNDTTTGTGYVTSYIEGGSGAYIADTDIVISDIDDTNIESASITITNVEAGDLLTVGALPPGITASSYDPVTGVITLSGSASLADYQTAIRAIEFSNDGSASGTPRSIAINVNDGDDNSAAATTTVNMTLMPTVSVTDVSVQEPGTGTTTLTFTIQLDQTLTSDLTFNYQTSDISALAGADYTGLATTTGTIIAGATSTTVSVIINSDTNVYEGDETFGLNLTNFNQTVNFNTGAHTITGGVQGIGSIGANNGAPVAEDDVFITAPDTPLTTGNVLTNDTLVDNAVVNSFDSISTAGGTVSYNNDGTFDYTPTAGFTGTDTFTYQLIDDDGEVDTATVTIEVTNAVVSPPVVSTVPDSSYTENGSPVNLLVGTSLTDVDSTTLSSVVVKISGYIASQDVLDYLAAGTSVNASLSVTGNVWELTLSGGTDINEYVTVLNTLTYENLSENPSTSARTITVEAYDEAYNNLFSSDSGSLSISPVNDAPVVADNDVYTVESSNDNALNIVPPTDFDNDDSTLIITVTGVPASVGTVMMADGITPVAVGQTLSLAELTSLVFDSGTIEAAEAFTYTVSDGVETVIGTTTIDVGTTKPDFNTVYESGLADGTESDSGLNTATGNLFTNDAVSAPSIDSIDFGASNYTPVSGVISFATPLGTLTVYADNSTPGHKVGDYEYVLNSSDSSGNDVNEAFTYNFTNVIAYSDTLNITIQDDIPIANNLVEDIPESEEKTFNLMFTLDISTSMRALVGTTGQSRLDLAKDALTSLGREYFNQSTKVDITVLLFADGGHTLGTYDNYTDFEAAISNVRDAGTAPAYTNNSPNDPDATITNSTSYNDALSLIEAEFNTDLADQSAQGLVDVQNISYFLSDGQVTSNGTPIGNGFDTFVNDNSIDSYSVGIGTGLPGDLSDLNFIHNIDSYGKGNGTVDEALIISDVTLLESELLSTVPTAFGGNITVNGTISNVLFGADSGYVESITMDIGTFNYDGSTITVPAALAGTVEIDGSRLILNADDGFAYGTFTFDFSDGSYLFIAPNGMAPNSFDVDYSIVDGDGDIASATATINIVDDTPTARDDLDTINHHEAAAGNVITGLGTDAGPQFGTGFTAFASQGGGIDKVVDNADITSFNYKGEVFDLDFVSVPADGGSGSLQWTFDSETNLDGDLITQVVVTDTSDNSILVFRSNGYYSYTPEEAGTAVTPTNVVITSSANAAAGGISLSSPDGALNYGWSGVGIQGGTSNWRVDYNETLVIDFDTIAMPLGVTDITLGLTSWDTDEEVLIDIYDTSSVLIIGNLLFDSASIDLSGYSGIGRVEMTGANSTDPTNVRLYTVDYTQVIAPTVTALDPVTLEYVLTDSDGQSDSAQLSIYTIDNTVTGTVGVDNISGLAENDAIIGEAGDDILAGNAGHDTLSGGAGSDTLSGGVGHDYLSGGDDNDTLFGNADNDHLAGDAGDDILDGGLGNDILQGGAGVDLLFGGSNDDNLDGGAGNDALYGGAGADMIIGDEGDDLIFGGAGNDILTGGKDRDTFSWKAGDEGSVLDPAVDIVTDFDDTAGRDVLDISNLLIDEENNDLGDYLEIQFTDTDGDGDSETQLQVDTDGSVGGFQANQIIILESVDLTAGGTLSEQDIINNLLTKATLVTD